MRSTGQNDPFALAALVSAGALVGHELGYLAAGASGGGHGYFAVAGPIAIASVVAAVWASAVSVMRRGAAKAPSVAALSLAQSILYVCFEVGERAVSSVDTPLLSLSVLAGLVAQPLVAWLAVRALRLATTVLAAVAIVASSPTVAAPIHPRAESRLGFTLALPTTAAPRGPPLSSHF